MEIDIYKILIRQGVPSQGRAQLWRYHTITGGEHWQTSDITELEDEVRNLLQENPIPIIDIVKTVSFDVSVVVD